MFLIFHSNDHPGGEEVLRQCMLEQGCSPSAVLKQGNQQEGAKDKTPSKAHPLVTYFFQVHPASKVSTTSQNSIISC